MYGWVDTRDNYISTRLFYNGFKCVSDDGFVNKNKSQLEEFFRFFEESEGEESGEEESEGEESEEEEYEEESEEQIQQRRQIAMEFNRQALRNGVVYWLSDQVGKNLGFDITFLKNDSNLRSYQTALEWGWVDPISDEDNEKNEGDNIKGKIRSDIPEDLFNGLLVEIRKAMNNNPEFQDKEKALEIITRMETHQKDLRKMHLAMKRKREDEDKKHENKKPRTRNP